MKAILLITAFALFSGFLSHSQTSFLSEEKIQSEISKYRGNNTTPYPKQIEVLDSLLKIYEQTPNINREHLSTLHVMLGVRYIYTNQLSKAEQHLRLTFINKDDYLHAYANYLLGNIFVDLKNYQEALIYYEKVTLFHEDYFSEKAAKINLANAKGICCENIDHHKDALKYYSEAIKLSKESHDLEGLIMSLLHKSNLLGEHFRKSIEAEILLQEAIILSKEINNQPLLAHSLSNLCKVKLLNNEYDSIQQLITESNHIALRFDLKDILIFNKYIMSTFYKKNGDHQKAFKYLEEYHHLKDSIFNRTTQDKIIGLHESLQTEQQEKLLLKKQKELELAEKEEELSRQLFIKLTVIAIAGITLLVIIIMKLRSDLKKRKELGKISQQLALSEIRNRELEKNQFQKIISYKNKSLTDLATNITRKRKFTEYILENLKSMKESESKEEQIKELISFTSRNLNVDERLGVFLENVQTINHDFFEKLENKHPGLTEGEKQLCALFRLKLSNKDIASIKVISADSAKNMKSRLKRKLNIPEEVNFQEYLIEI